LVYPVQLTTLGDHIRARRLDLGLRQSNVAKQLGAYTSTANTLENHHFSPHVCFMPKILEFLGYDPFGPPPTTFPDRGRIARING
jgi:transcriptional regulator with XRE-family HTH domain